MERKTHDEIVHRREELHQQRLDKANSQTDRNARIAIWFARFRDHIVKPVIRKFPVKIPLVIREKMPLLGQWHQNRDQAAEFQKKKKENE